MAFSVVVIFERRLSLGSTAIERIKALPTIHGDPFDRLIIAQAQMEDMTIVT